MQLCQVVDVWPYKKSKQTTAAKNIKSWKCKLHWWEYICDKQGSAFICESIAATQEQKYFENFWGSVYTITKPPWRTQWNGLFESTPGHLYQPASS